LALTMAPESSPGLVSGSLLASIPAGLSEEFTEILAGAGAVRIERIISRGQSSREGFWYDQDEAEFVLLLRGSAGLRLEGWEKVLTLEPGDYLIIPPHVRHRVEWTDGAGETVWLAVFYPVAS
jgi:cupin 2 domain-containing protein